MTEKTVEIKILGKTIQAKVGETIVNALWASDGLSGDLTLQPRDQVVIPSDDVFVTVIGEVNRPGVIPFQFGLTVSDYLLRAGGATREADLGLVHFVDRTGRRLATAKLDAAVKTGDILIVERQRYRIFTLHDRLPAEAFA